MIAETAIPFIDCEEFHAPNAADRILAPLQLSRRTHKPPTGPSSYLAELCRFPLLTAEQEAHGFRQMNYLKFLAAELRAVNAHAPELADRLLKQAGDVRNLLVRSNLRLVVHLARRRPRHFWDRISDGNIALLRAVDSFDFTLGPRFAAYAFVAIRRSLAHAAHVAAVRSERFRTEGTDPTETDRFSLVEDPQSFRDDRAINLAHRAIVKDLLSQMPERDQRILTGRFGLNDGTPESLKELAWTLGVSSERVRQLEGTALARLRRLAVNLEVPGI